MVMSPLMPSNTCRAVIKTMRKRVVSGIGRPIKNTVPSRTAPVPPAFDLEGRLKQKRVQLRVLRAEPRCRRDEQDPHR